MKLTEVFPSKYLNSDDLGGDDQIATIMRLTFEKMKDTEGKEEDKPVLWFRGIDKGLVLNKTNATRISQQHGDETDNWVGKSITLTSESVTAFGETKFAIRVKAQPPRPPAGKPSAFAKASPQAEPASAFGGDSDIPS